jgi:hypothetical protein
METNPVVVQAEEAVDASVAAFTAALAANGFAVPGAVSLAPGGLRLRLVLMMIRCGGLLMERWMSLPEWHGAKRSWRR